MYKLSIIIPIYNAEKYIKECFDSILIQVHPQVEFICINDGSVDQSFSILRDLLEGYSEDIQNQFLLVEQENQGPSQARNKGIELAQSEYIGFVDADDKIKPNYFSEVLKLINNNSYDIIDFDIEMSNNNLVKIRKGDITKIDSVFRASNWFNCARIIKKKYFINNSFTPNIYYEDLALMPLLYIEALSTIYISKPLYWYRINQESITLSTSNISNINTINSLDFITNNYIKIYKENKNLYIGAMIVNAYFLLCINCCKRLGFIETYKYIEKYQEFIKHDLNIEIKNIDFLSLKFKLFIRYPINYLIFYKSYFKIKAISR